MPRILLLCFVHGFKGDDSSFGSFPDDLKQTVAGVLPHHRVHAVVYPRYETSGELADASRAFLEWLKARVADLHSNDVDVVLVAHSMGGFVAADALLLALDSPSSSHQQPPPPPPPIRGLVAFDTPLHGLARRMFVYGALDKYTKLHAALHLVTALSAGPVALGSRLATSARTRSLGRRAWQLVGGVRTGTVGVLAAGGYAAYTHRKAIAAGLKKLKTRGLGLHRFPLNHRLNMASALARLSAHVTFVGALVDTAARDRRLQRLARMQRLHGIGLRVFYASLGADYSLPLPLPLPLPERTFCAVPKAASSSSWTEAAALFERWPMAGCCDDEVQAHMGLFQRERNAGYDAMTARTAALVQEWVTKDNKDNSIQTGTSAATAIVIDDDNTIVII